MASSSGFKQESVPMNNIDITPEATYEAVVADPKLFMGTLEKLHSDLGTKFMVPIIGGRHVDLHKLFVEVTSRGGIKQILDEKRWREVTASFSFPATATNATYVLRKYYFSLLSNYELVYFSKSNRQIPPGSLTGSNVTGVIDGKFEDGYLVTVTVGSEQLKGVLYEIPPQDTVAHQTPEQSHGVSPSAWNNNANAQGIAGGVAKRRRRRRVKSVIKRRNPGQPKPNRSGYTFFFAEQHARLKPLHPGNEFVEIGLIISKLWKNLNEQDKAVYQGMAMEDKERYRNEMEDYKEMLRTGQLSNAVPLQHKLPEQNVDMAEADLPIEEAGEVEEEEGDSSGFSGESEPDDDQNVEADPDQGDLSVSSLGINLNLPPKEQMGDVEMDIPPVKKAKEPTVEATAEHN